MRIQCSVLLQLACCVVVVSAEKLDERPAADSEWGYRPAPGAVSGRESPQLLLASAA